MKKILAAAGVKTQSEQQGQHEELMGDIAKVLERHNASLADLSKKQQDDFAAAVRDIAKLREDLTQHRALTIEQLKAIGAGVGRGESYRGKFDSSDTARDFGKLVMAVVAAERGNMQRLQELQKAAVVPTTGEAGGALLRETMIGGIIRNVEDYSVVEREALQVPMGSMRGALAKRVSGAAVSYPDYGVSVSDSNLKFGSVPLELIRYQALALVDNSMLSDDLAIGLGEYAAAELAQAVALATDSNALIGDGTVTYAKATGLFKLAADATNGPFVVTADTGHNTFAEVLAESTYYLGRMFGKLPQWAHFAMPKWFMSISILGELLGVRDSQKRPVWNVIMEQGQPQMSLMGYPIVPTQVGPIMDDSGNSKPLMLLASLRKALGLARHKVGARLEVDRSVKFLEDMTAIKLILQQGLATIDARAVARLESAAS